MIAIVDCNSFFVSCERVFNPALRGKPVVVLSNNDGCIVSRSDEAKALGIGMANPYYQWKSFFEKHGVYALSSNYVLYGDMSERVMNVLASFTPEIEIYSIDEAFLNLSGFRNLSTYISEIRNTVYQYTGIPVTIGLAPTKTLSKVANRIAKQRKTGHMILDHPETIRKALARVKIGDVWGIGRQYEKRLRLHGIQTALDLTKRSDSWLLKEMTVVGLRLVKELRGMPCLDLELVRPSKKGLCCSRQFGKLTNHPDDLREAVAEYATSLAGDLRKEKSCCSGLTVFTQTNRYSQQYGASGNISLPVPSNSTSEIVKYALSCLEKIYRPGIPYKKCGVLAYGIVPENQVQGHLFYSRDWEKRKKIDQVFDRLNGKYGSGTLTTASEGIRKEWYMKREKLSPDYTTNWKDIMEVKIG